ncbi:hypothetical protein HK096_004364 [Nowakowskiella sp. JEL0078]|nr:hypothetical protein HK096_004364 [Nowakowskiella sp. JEL0078]
MLISEKFVGELDESDLGTAHWVPKVIELIVPYLRDDNRNVRRIIGDVLLKLINFLSTTTDRTPTVSRKREDSNLVIQLRRLYHERLPRNRRLFAKTGPDFTQHALNSTPNVTPVNKDLPNLPEQRRLSKQSSKMSLGQLAPSSRPASMLIPAANIKFDCWSESWDEAFERAQPTTQENNTEKDTELADEIFTDISKLNLNNQQVTLNNITDHEKQIKSEGNEEKRIDFLKKKREMRLTFVQKRKDEKLKMKIDSGDVNVRSLSDDSGSDTILTSSVQKSLVINPLVLRNRAESPEKFDTNPQTPEEENVDFFKDMDPLSATSPLKNVVTVNLESEKVSEKPNISKMLLVVNDEEIGNSLWEDDDLNLEDI